MKKVMLLAVVVSMALGMSSVSRAADDAAPKKDKAARHAELLTLETIDVGYRLLVTDL